MLGLVGLELADDALDLGARLALVPTGAAGVVPGPELPEELVGLAVGLDVVELLLRLVERFLGGLLELVEETHRVDPRPLKAPPRPADQQVMRTDIQRRQVAYDASTGTLTVGGRMTVVTCDPGDNECLLRTYLDLVAEQRDIRLGQGVHLRRDDVAVLAELLDLDDADLEGRLRRILRLSEAQAADLHRRLVRHRVAAAAVGVGLLAGVPATALAGADEAAGEPAATVPVAAVVQVDPVVPDSLDRAVVVVSEAAPVVAPPPPAPAPAPPAPVVEPEPVVAVAEPAPAPEVEIGHAVTYEQDPTYVAPEGVDIGESLVIER